MPHKNPSARSSTGSSLTDRTRPAADEPASEPASEKNSTRLTFFLRESDYQALQLQVACFRVSTARPEYEGPSLPPTPSALLREIIQHWLDQFPMSGPASFSEEERDSRLKLMKAAVNRMKR